MKKMNEVANLKNFISQNKVILWHFNIFASIDIKTFFHKEDT